MKNKRNGYFSQIFRIMLIPVLCFLIGINILQENSIFFSGTSADLKFKTNQNENDSQTFPRLYCPEEPVLFQTGTDRYGKEERQIDDDWYNKVSGPSGMMNITSRMMKCPDRISRQTAQTICASYITGTDSQQKRVTLSVSQKTQIIGVLSLKLKMKSLDWKTKSCRFQAAIHQWKRIS